MQQLRGALEEHGWDGDWYRRAYFDDGTPLGSASNVECRIDSIAQSWSVLSGAAERCAAERAMAAVDEYLIRRGDGLVLLFTPRSITPTSTRATSRDTSPASARTAASTPTEPSGRCSHSPPSATATKAGELFSILNPINHTSTTAGVYRYKVEPYVMAADVYGEPPHTGRGGWTWYTGAAGWMYQAGIEWILGFHLRGTELNIVDNPHALSRGIATSRSTALLPEGASVELHDDGVTHRIGAVLGSPSRPDPSSRS